MMMHNLKVYILFPLAILQPPTLVAAQDRKGNPGYMEVSDCLLKGYFLNNAEGYYANYKGRRGWYKASCGFDDKKWRMPVTLINLNDCLTNEAGVLKWSNYGNFLNTCDDCGPQKQFEGNLFTCNCKTGNGDERKRTNINLSRSFPINPLTNWASN